MKRTVQAVLVAAAAALPMCAVVLVGEGSAAAAVGSADDRQLSTPTGWATYHGITAAQVTSHLTANAARLTSIQVSSSTPTFTVTMVDDSGTYGVSGWWWYYGQTEAQVNNKLSAKHARPISISAYSTSAGLRYAVVMVENTGANAKASWWYHGTANFIAGRIDANNARLITLQPFPGGGFTAVMVDNTGTNAAGWWWYHGASAAQVNSHLGEHHARLIDVSRNGDGTYNVVMYRSSARSYWWFGFSPSAMLAKANQLGERIISVFSYGSRQVAAMTENLNSAGQKLFQIISPKVDSGAYGFYLKQVGGATLAALQSTKQYEPASALKVLYHAKSIHEEALGNTIDLTSITYHYHNLADPNDGDICPDDYDTTRTTNLKNADTLMMQNSDNRMTRGILERYTKTGMLTYATSLGLTSTQINHNIGCGTPHNKTTLADLGKVYEAFQTGTVTSNTTWKSNFRSRMLNETNYEPQYHNSICGIVNQEATALGKSAATANSFCNAMTWIAKGGSYEYADNFPYAVSWDGLSLTGVPYQRSGVAAPRYFVFGEFVDGTKINSQTEADSVNNARGKLYQEALRPYIHAALATW